MHLRAPAPYPTCHTSVVGDERAEEGGSPDEQRVVWRLMDVIARGAKTHSYKFAVIMAIIDLVMERVDDHGRPPATIDGDEVVIRVLQTYWRQTAPLDEHGHAAQGSQVGGLVDKVAERRDRLIANGWTIRTVGLFDAPELAPLRRSAERSILGYAVPLLQFAKGTEADPFLFHTWPEQRTRFPDNRNRILTLLPGAGDTLLKFGPLLRDVVRAEWLAFVRARNTDRVPQDQLAQRLFGASRIGLGPARDALRVLDGDACFYCGSLPRDVDHFLPWSRTFEDGRANLVLACQRCNATKSDRLAGIDPLNRWRTRLDDPRLPGAAEEVSLRSGVGRCTGLARALYLPAAVAAVPLWLPAGEDVLTRDEALLILA